MNVPLPTDEGTDFHPAPSVARPRSAASLAGWIVLAMASVAGVALVAWRLIEDNSSKRTPTETGFQKSAELFIEGDAVAKQAGTTFTGAACIKPPALTPGTTFTCTATDADGTAWAFVLVVKDSSNFEITSGQPAG